jgi:Flp pilus assembly protein TadD
MPTLQEQYDDAMFAFSMGDFDTCITGLKAILAEDPNHFDARLSVGMAYCRKGDFATAIEEGHKAEKLQPNEQLVHTNLSLFYMRAGDKQKAEHHGLQARVASWRGNMAPPPAPGAQAAAESDSELKLAEAPPPPPVKMTVKVPDQPWKKKT